MSWDNPSSRKKRQALTSGIGESTTGSGAFLYNQGARAGGIGAERELSPTLKTDHNPAIYQIAGNIIGREPENGSHQLGITDPDEDGVFTLTATDRHAVYCASDSGTNSAIGLDIAPTLTVHDSKSASYVSVPSTLQIRSGKAGGGKGALVAEDMSATLTTGVQQTLFPGNGTVRRLTPLECERLQGFPDEYTDIPYRGKPHAPDSARYKALGNSMAVPVMQWIGRRIKEMES
jgi:DNA (cytosine-5)-methyltransferase 1